MNYFFKYLLPQLMEYFNNDKESIKEFLPKVIEKNALLYRWKMTKKLIIKMKTKNKNLKQF